MAGSGTGVSGRRKQTLTFSRYVYGTAMAAAGATKLYLVGNDDDDGYTFDTPCRITRMSWQLTTTEADGSATAQIVLSKGTEATTVYDSTAIAVATEAAYSGSDTAAASLALSRFTTSDDLIIAITLASLATLELDVCVQVDVEFED